MFKQNKIVIIVAVAIIAAAGLIYAFGNDKIQPGGNGGRNNGQSYEKGLRLIDSTDHVRGDLNAPVKIIVYSDFECPFCSKFAATIKQVEQEFKEKAVIAFRHYPLRGHREAEKAAEASECAAEQGKFWEMHDKLFADNAAGRMGAEQYKIDASELGLDQAKFNQCLDSGQYASKIRAQKTEGDNAGVTGTPTSFANGIIYPGAYPFEDFISSDGQPEKGMKNIIGELLK